jgi:hypothetical protein
MMLERMLELGGFVGSLLDDVWVVDFLKDTDSSVGMVHSQDEVLGGLGVRWRS